MTTQESIVSLLEITRKQRWALERISETEGLRFVHIENSTKEELIKIIDYDTNIARTAIASTLEALIKIGGNK